MTRVQFPVCRRLSHREFRQSAIFANGVVLLMFAIVPPLLFAFSALKAQLQLLDVPHDGDCMFTAVALSAAIVDQEPANSRARALRNAAAQLRSDALDVLCPAGYPAEVEPLASGLPASVLVEPRVTETGAEYCSRMRRAGEWGSSAELLALTRVLGRPIRVYTPYAKPVRGVGPEGSARVPGGSGAPCERDAQPRAASRPPAAQCVNSARARGHRTRRSRRTARSTRAIAPRLRCTTRTTTTRRLSNRAETSCDSVTESGHTLAGGAARRPSHAGG